MLKFRARVIWASFLKTFTIILCSCHSSPSASGTEQNPASYAVELYSLAFRVGSPIHGLVQALGPSGTVLTNSNFTVQLHLLSATNAPLFGPLAVPLTNGVASFTLTPYEPVQGGYLQVEGRSAFYSRRINIYPRLHERISGEFRDFVIVPGSGELLASVASDATTNANQIVKIDPATGAPHSWYVQPGLFPATNPHAGKLTVSPDGSTVIAIAGNGAQLLAFDSATGKIKQIFNLPASAANNLVTTVGNDPSLWRLLATTPAMTCVFEQSGTARTNSQIFEIASAHPSRPDTAYLMPQYPQHLVEWNCASFQPIAYYSMIPPLAFARDRLFALNGKVVDTKARAAVGTLNPISSGVLTPDASGHLIIRLFPFGATRTRVEAYTTDDLLLRQSFDLSLGLHDLRKGAALSLARLAVLNSNELHFIHLPRFATNSGADLRVDVIAPSAPGHVGMSNYWKIQLENAGSEAATEARLDIYLPHEVVVTNYSMSQESSINGGNGFLYAYIPFIAPGEKVEVNFSATPVKGGFLDLRATFGCNEHDPDYSNNSATYRYSVGMEPSNEDVSTLWLPVRSMAFNSVTQKIYALELNKETNTSTILYEIDANTFLSSQMRLLPGYASHLRVSKDGRFLHAAIKNGTEALSLNLRNDTNALRYDLGGTNFILRGLEVSPSDGGSIVVAGFNPVPRGPMTDYWLNIAMYSNGARKPASIELWAVDLASDRFPEGGFLAVDEYSEGCFAMQHWNYEKTIGFSMSSSGLQEQYRNYIRTPRFVLTSKRIYNIWHEEIMATNGQRWRKVPTRAEVSPIIVYQPKLDQLLYLNRKDWQTTRIEVFQRATLARIGAIDFLSQNEFQEMVDLTDGRILLRSSTGDLTILRNELFGGLRASTDLRIDLLLEPRKPVADQEASLALIARNAGFNSSICATLVVMVENDVLVSACDPAPNDVISFSGGGPKAFVWTNLVLAGGSSITNFITATFRQTSNSVIHAGIADQTMELVPEDNSLSYTVRDALPPLESALEIRRSTAVPFRLVFDTPTYTEWFLQTSSTLDGPWTSSTNAVAIRESQVVTLNLIPDSNAFFRVLIRPAP